MTTPETGGFDQPSQPSGEFGAEPGYASPGYQATPPMYYPYQVRRPTNNMAIVALIMIFVFAPLAIVFGAIARKQIRQTGEEGDGMALAGIIAGSVLSAITVIMLVIMIVIFVSLAHTITHLPDMNTLVPAPPT